MLQHVIEEMEGRRTGLPVIEKGGWEKRKAVYIRSTLRQNRIHYLDGKTYEMEEKHVGLMPLMMQVFHNNFTDGIGKSVLPPQGTGCLSTCLRAKRKFRWKSAL